MYPCKTNTFSTSPRGHTLHQHRHGKLDVEEFVTDNNLHTSVPLIHKRGFLYSIIIYVLYSGCIHNAFLRIEFNVWEKAMPIRVYVSSVEAITSLISKTKKPETERLKLSHRTETRTNRRKKRSFTSYS